MGTARTAGEARTVVSAGGTGSYQYSADCPGITELQAGGGIFADPCYIKQCGVTGLEPALSVLVTVTSRPKLERAVTDAGRKTINPDLEPPVIKGTVTGRPLPDAAITGLSAEHGILRLDPSAQGLRVGERLEIIPGYSDLTNVLHDRFYALRGERVEGVWPLEARGRLA